MRLNDFDYILPKNLIAQSPVKDRVSSKLLILDKESKKIKDDMFFNIKNHLNKGDVLVLNNSKVIPARLVGKKEDTLANVEIFLLEEIDKDKWLCIGKPLKRLKVSTKIIFSDSLSGVVLKKELESVVIKFSCEGSFLEEIEKVGKMPTPPYIKKELKKRDSYQTVYAKYIGSVAAPTAGLHFTNELLNELKEKGVTILYVTLHVGLATFKGVTESDISKHKMHSETFFVDSDTACALNDAIKNKKNIYAVGTTSVRVIESMYLKYGKFIEAKEKTDIFIYPGFKFSVISGIITNFHLPKSTLLMLVSAYGGYSFIKDAYKHATDNNYRFYSFGDAMFIKGEK